MVVRIECAVESERARPLVIELAVACRTERSGKFSWTVDARCDAAAVHGLIMGSHALPAWACMATIPAPGALTHACTDDGARWPARQGRCHNSKLAVRPCRHVLFLL